MGIMVRNFLITFAVFMVIDLIWLGFIAKGLYAKYLGFIMTDKVNWVAAVVFYILFIIGMMVFVINPSESLKQVMLLGAFFGFVTYATYDLTNLATLKNWPLTITLIDLTWGTVLSFATATISYLIINKI